MIISFWSPFSGKGSVTTSMILTAMTHSLVNEGTVPLATTTCKDDSFESMFEKRVDFNEFVGIDGVEQLLQATKLTPGTLKDQTITAMKGSLEILPWKKTTSEKTILDFIPTYLKALEDYEIVFMDLSSGPLDTLRKRIAEKSDIIVICIPHSGRNSVHTKEVIKDLKSQGKHIMVMVEKFDSTSKPSLTTLTVDLGLSKSEMYNIPYINFIKDDSESGDILKLLTRFELQPPKFIKEPIHKLKAELLRMNREIIKKGGR